jgi:hypothetical protein
VFVCDAANAVAFRGVQPARLIQSSGAPRAAMGDAWRTVALDAGQSLL